MKLVYLMNEQRMFDNNDGFINYT